jgi:hypothetical protein
MHCKTTRIWDKETDVSTTEKSTDAKSKETLLLAHSIAIGKFLALRIALQGAVELPEGPELARDVFPDNEWDDDD